jgi:hypothetical protein
LGVKVRIRQSCMKKSVWFLVGDVE